MRTANQSALLMQKNDLYFHLIAITFTSVLSGFYLRGKGWQHCQTSMKLEHSSQLMEHCKDKLPTPAWLCFLSYCTQHLSHILILSTAFSWPNQRARYVFWVNRTFFLFVFFSPSLKLKTGIDWDAVSLHCHKTTVTFTYHCRSVWMELGGSNVKISVWLKKRGREMTDSFFCLQWHHHCGLEHLFNHQYLTSSIQYSGAHIRNPGICLSFRPGI